MTVSKHPCYYYWLRKFPKEAYDQMQVPAVVRPAEVSFTEISIKVAAPPETTPYTLFSGPVAVIKCGHISIEISNDVLEAMLSRLLQEVVHA